MRTEAPDVTIRYMEEKDLHKVAEIEKEIFSQPWSEEGFRSSMTSNSTIYLVAEEAREVCGYCGLLQALDEADITNVAMQKDFRGRGIAGKMLTELMKLGEEKGITGFTLEVRKSNGPALRLYQKLGFEIAGIRKNFYDFPKEDAVIMWKYLERG